LYNKSFENFKGAIGRDSANANQIISNYVTVKLLCAPIKAGVISIKRLGAIFACNVTFDVNIYSNESRDVPLYTIQVTSNAGRLTWSSVGEPIELPMYSENSEHLVYYFTYQNPGFAPKNNKFRCCGFNPTFNYTSPYFSKTVSDPRYRWYAYVNATSQTGNTLEAVNTCSGGFNDKAYGLLIDCEMKCSTADVLCYDLDFRHSSVALVLAHALRYKAGTILIQNILSSGRPNIYTLTGGERLMQENSRYKSEYANRVKWLVENIDLSATGCYECNKRFVKRSML
jgi:hypothetical protein